MFPLPLDNLGQVNFAESKEEPTDNGPTFYRCVRLSQSRCLCLLARRCMYAL